MADPRILLVDDDEIIRLTLSTLLNKFGFAVTTAGNTAEALRLIHSATFEVLISDLHMPGAGDGLTVVSAMRHANPRAVTMLLSAFPEMAAATHAILLQADEILVKPMDILELVKVIRQRLARGTNPSKPVQSVVHILERNSQKIIKTWLRILHEDRSLQSIEMSSESRSSHLPCLLNDLVLRLQSIEPMGLRRSRSRHAYRHGRKRCHDGYSAALLVEESRILQISIFQTLQDNLATLDFSMLLPEVMTIADEVDSQLSQAMEGFSEAAMANALSA